VKVEVAGRKRSHQGKYTIEESSYCQNFMKGKVPCLQLRTKKKIGGHVVKKSNTEKKVFMGS